MKRSPPFQFGLEALLGVVVVAGLAAFYLRSFGFSGFGCRTIPDCAPVSWQNDPMRLKRPTRRWAPVIAGIAGPIFPCV
jgi:hypothetical protein